ncbi:MAG: hypothetical protein WCE90_10005 [Candidatus Zixiibacteriota bacterium]
MFEAQTIESNGKIEHQFSKTDPRYGLPQPETLAFSLGARSLVGTEIPFSPLGERDRARGLLHIIR